MTELTRYLDPKTLARLEKLELMARAVVEGFLAGRHRSPWCGSSAEFAQHRPYVAGDDIRLIDWKVQARSDRAYIKQRQDQTNLPVSLLVDVSESMRVGGAGGGLSKHRYAACAAAALAWLLLEQRDAVSLATFDERLRTVVKLSSHPAHLQALLAALESPPGRGKTALGAVCHGLAASLPRRGLVCLASDLLGDLDETSAGLGHLRHRGHDVIVLHVLAEEELTFPFTRPTRFVGLERTGTLTVAPRALREDYLRAMRTFRAHARRCCIACRADYRLASTADNLGATLAAFLAARAAAVRKASGKR